MDTAIQNLLPQAVDEGHLEFVDSGKMRKVRYVVANISEKWSDPKEKVRAAFFAELIDRYGYEPEHIGVEVAIPDRVSEDRADLVIFQGKGCTRPYAVIECRRDNISDSEFRQAVKQVFSHGIAFGARYIGVIAGQARAFFNCSEKLGIDEHAGNIIADLPVQYGKPEVFKYYKKAPGKQDIRVISRADLIQTVRKCHRTLWGGGRLSPPTAFGELTKLVFLKTRDEKLPRKSGEPYEFQIKTNEAPRCLAKRLKEMYATEREKEQDIFSDDIRIDDITLRNVVIHLERINLTATDMTTKDIAFEQFIESFFKGDSGRYSTPCNIIAFMNQMLDIRHDDFVIDPACGVGGFLLHALEHVRGWAEGHHQDNVREQCNGWRNFAEKQLFGIEINTEAARVAKMNMIIHEGGHTNIIKKNALEPLASIGEKSAAFARIMGINQKNGKRDETKGFDKILTHPPFGAKLIDGFRNHLSEYNLPSFHTGRKWLPRFKIEVVFCERVWQLLKPGGRVGMVVPDNLLSATAQRPVRDWLLERFKILAVISLPPAAFAHLGSRVKSSLLFLEKYEINGAAGNDDHAIFMAIAENIGYDSKDHSTCEVEVLEEKQEVSRIERHRCDLFEWQVEFDWVPGEGDQSGRWSERRRHVVPGSGLLGKYDEFKERPKRFFV